MTAADILNSINFLPKPMQYINVSRYIVKKFFLRSSYFYVLYIYLLITVVYESYIVILLDYNVICSISIQFQKCCIDLKEKLDINNNVTHYTNTNKVLGYE